MLLTMPKVYKLCQSMCLTPKIFETLGFESLQDSIF